MQLREYILEEIAVMIIGDNNAFPYRKSSNITKFFRRCGFDFVHDGTTRKWWALDRLKELNVGASQAVDLPSKDLTTILCGLFEPDDFECGNLSRDIALAALNKVIVKQSLEGYLSDGTFYLRNTGTGQIASSHSHDQRPLTAEELAQRKQVETFLGDASEDEFTEKLLVPLFQRLGFRRVSALGHTEKTMEYGKDLWMKFQLPTGHWLYFGAQVKRDKLDARGGSGDSNTATVLSQVRMAIDHPIFDPETNRKVLVDHVFVISAGEITRAARHWLVEKLDQSQRRTIIFMDKSEFLDHSARILTDISKHQNGTKALDDQIPF